MGRPSLVTTLALATLCVAAPPLRSHEIEANRLTLVQRERNHVTLNFQLDLVPILHRLLAPRSSVQEFVLSHAALPLPVFRTQLLRAQAQLQERALLARPDGTPVAITNWSWPAPEQVQGLMQQRAMRAITADDHADHDAVTTVSAQALSTGDLSSLDVRLPDEVAPVLVVSYRPRQTWLERKSPVARIRF